MIPHDDFAKSQKPHWLPFLELEFISPASEERVSGLRRAVVPVKLEVPVRSPRPTPPVSPRPSQKPEKPRILAFMKKLVGHHTKKTNKNEILMDFGKVRMQGESIWELEEFLLSVFEFEEANSLMKDKLRMGGLSPVWEALQNDSSALPVLWKTSADEVDSSEEIRRNKKNNNLMIDQENSCWQIVSQDAAQFPKLLGLLKAMASVADGWLTSFNGFASCVIEEFTKRARDEDCLALAEFLVAKLPSEEGVSLFVTEASEGLAPVEKAMVDLVGRCWASQLVFRLSIDFWESPWWDRFITCQSAAADLLKKLVSSDSQWKLLIEPMPNENANAIYEWMDSLPLDGVTKELGQQWFTSCMALMRTGGSSYFVTKLQELFRFNTAPDDSEEDDSAKWCRRVRTESLKQGVTGGSIAWLCRAHMVQDKLLQDAKDAGRYLSYSWRCYLRAALMLDPNTPKPSEALINLIIDSIPKSMGVQDIRLLCLCFPWLHADHAQKIADALVEKMQPDGSVLKRTVCGNAGLWGLVVLQLASFCGAQKSAASLAALFDVHRHRVDQHLNSEMDGGHDLALFLAYSSFEFWSGDSAFARMPQQLRTHIQKWGSLLPEFGNKNVTQDNMELWVGWLRDSMDNKQLLKPDCIARWLAVTHVLGFRLVSGSDLSKEDVPPQLVNTLVEMVSMKWPRNVLVCELFLCLVLPYACALIREGGGLDRLAKKLLALNAQVSLAMDLSEEASTSDDDHLTSNRLQLFALLLEMPACLGSSASQSISEEDGMVTAYRVLAKACMAVHLGASDVELKAADLRLEFAVAALQARPKVGMALSSLLVCRKHVGRVLDGIRH